jgi:hypothetical protein
MFTSQAYKRLSNDQQFQELYENVKNLRKWSMDIHKNVAGHKITFFEKHLLTWIDNELRNAMRDLDFYVENFLTSADQ